MNETATTAQLTVDDPRAVLARAVTTARQLVDQLTDDQFVRPTPCTEYTVVDLLGHVLAVLQRVGAAGRGEDPMQINGQPPFAVVSDWPLAFAEAAHAIDAAWTHDGTLDSTIVMPWATLSGRAYLAMYTNEITVHSWDLAAATGQTPAWDPDVLDVAMGAIQFGLPADHRIAGLIPFANVVPTADDASLIDRLVAWNGRQP